MRTSSPHTHTKSDEQEKKKRGKKPGRTQKAGGPRKHRAWGGQDAAPLPRLWSCPPLYKCLFICPHLLFSLIFSFFPPLIPQHPHSRPACRSPRGLPALRRSGTGGTKGGTGGTRGDGDRDLGGRGRAQGHGHHPGDRDPGGARSGRAHPGAERGGRAGPGRVVVSGAGAWGASMGPGEGVPQTMALEGL